LSGIITEVSGMNTWDFADKYLCKPLDIKIIDWFQSPEGIYRGSNAIYITSRDLARFGYLYLSGGKIKNKQIIPKKWVVQSIKEHVKVDIKINENYILTGAGYSWLSGKINNMDVFLTTDLGGQIILNIPIKNITIVTTTNKPFDYQLVDDFIYKLVSTIK
jgi:CubicO group peptidase (beta-lactamase class C family)